MTASRPLKKLFDMAVLLSGDADAAERWEREAISEALVEGRAFKGKITPIPYLEAEGFVYSIPFDLLRQGPGAGLGLGEFLDQTRAVDSATQVAALRAVEVDIMDNLTDAEMAALSTTAAVALRLGSTAEVFVEELRQVLLDSELAKRGYKR